MSLSRTKFTEWLKKNQNSKETSVHLNLRSRFVPTSFYRLWKGNKTSELNIDTTVTKICQCSKSFHGVLKHNQLICYSYGLDEVLIFKPCGFDKDWSKMTSLCIAFRNWEIFLSYRDFRCTTKHTILLFIYFSMSYMLCNLPLLNSGGSSGEATLNVVVFFFVFFLDRCTQWNILWKPRSINMSHPPMEMKL